MLTAILLAAIGSADLLRRQFRARAGRRPTLGAVLSVAVGWLLLAVLATTGLGVPPGWVALCLVAAGAWLALTTSHEHATGPAGRAAVVGLIVAVVVLLLSDRTALDLSGYLVDGHRDAAAAAVRDTPLPVVVLFIGVGLFLVESANIVVRIALQTRVEVPELPEQSDDVETSEPTDEARTDLTRSDLKGGRLIGPLERLLIVAIVLAGLSPIAAALVAAKGIVRFPEIAEDVKGGDGLSGTKAEYFLVGSLVSWATAAAAIALLVAAR
ncbi:hypothetical protein B7R54_09765 [Subtercola boreus]|uniref:Uncharacterized protein n=1 Tax=Subtercola boreus TaxID=120213 RepID=A0A3E0VJB7_9MICO|nr:hypothetical protein [Subtercola boreus]RFA09480.1 hypothetical protein B7R54_09765 [Subtercola boreus]TQL53465.1 hypothetical protein FB464_0974 [Subtercola boreus]